MPMAPTDPFKGRQYPGEVILTAVRWYLSSMALRATKSDENAYECCICQNAGGASGLRSLPQWIGRGRVSV